MTTIGVISDTHKLLRPEAKAQLRHSDLIIHAGDIGSADVISELEHIAPVRAIRGNIDKDAWADAYPDEDVVEVEGRFIYVLHNLRELALDPKAAGFDVVISGHSHRPAIERKNGVLYLNPGSAGPRRFTLPIALARLTLKDGEIRATIEEIQPRTRI
ncbi:MAG: metallophosphatase family protein [Candidatus Tectomicrobia bacterium]|nr:metallophosphatase family protein [Candidatus Tectomicrobia bacterium]